MNGTRLSMADLDAEAQARADVLALMPSFLAEHPRDWVGEHLAREGARLVPKDPEQPSLACLPPELLVLVMRYVAPDFAAMRAARLACHSLRLAVDASVFHAMRDCRLIELGLLFPADRQSMFFLAHQDADWPGTPERGVINGVSCCRRTLWAYQNPSRALACTGMSEYAVRRMQWGKAWSWRIEPILAAFPRDQTIAKVATAMRNLESVERVYGRVELGPLIERLGGDPRAALASFLGRVHMAHALVANYSRIEEARRAAHMRHAPLFGLVDGRLPEVLKEMMSGDPGPFSEDKLRGYLDQALDASKTLILDHPPELRFAVLPPLIDAIAPFDTFDISPEGYPSYRAALEDWYAKLCAQKEPESEPLPAVQ